MLKTDREPDLTMTSLWLTQMYDEEIEDVEVDIYESLWAIGNSDYSERETLLQDVANKQAYLEKLKELRAETGI